jgi:hypothetical protein
MEIREHTEQSSTQRKQFAILTKLVQNSTEMEHIDDMLFWLTGALSKHFEVQLIQIWAVQATTHGDDVALLRSGASEDPSLPQHVVYNANIAKMAANFLHQREEIPLQPIQKYFSNYQTKLFLRYGLHYCSGQFIQNNLLLPQRRDAPDTLNLATPLSMVILFFWHNMPSQDLLSSLHHTVKQAISIASLRNFLQAAVTHCIVPLNPYYADHIQHKAPALLGELIPQRLDSKNMRSRNPFANEAIPDKVASRLYYAIDGKKTIYQLASLLQLDNKTIFPALHFLLDQKLLQLYNANGKSVDKF